MQLSRDQASSVRSPSYVETSALVDSTRNCIRWDTGPGPWHPLDGHFLMLLRLAELFGLVLKISCLVSPRKKVRVCSFLGSQCSHLSASNCSLPISIHMEGHSSYRLSTFATRYKVFNTSGGKVECHVEINNLLRRFVNNWWYNLSQLLENRKTTFWRVLHNIIHQRSPGPIFAFYCSRGHPYLL